MVYFSSLFNRLNIISNQIVGLNHSEDGEKMVLSIPESQDLDYCRAIVTSYFNLDIGIDESIDQWKKTNPSFPDKHRNVRLIKQDLIETIFSFICSQNNNIKRIKKMVLALKQLFGKKILEYENESIHCFPNVDALAQEAIIEVLNKHGFGYRSKYIVSAAKFLLDKSSYLDQLQNMSYEESWNFLMTVPGIGPKVSDCIVLISLNKFSAVPIDRHIYRIIFSNFSTTKKALSLKNYMEMGNKFRKFYGPNAGWAQLLLFIDSIKI